MIGAAMVNMLTLSQYVLLCALVLWLESTAKHDHHMYKS